MKTIGPVDKMYNFTTIIKRDGSRVDVDVAKITLAVEKAMRAVEEFKEGEPAKIANSVVNMLEKSYKEDSSYEVTVERVQDCVELALMESGYHNVAKAYILYRDHRAQMRKRDIFKKRINLKPYEYPELLEYVDAIRHSYWIHTEFNFTSDIQDFKVHVTEPERNAIQNAMLAIAQIEDSVKTFWGDVYKKMPKTEVGSVGVTFAESEVRHADAYSHLLEILGLNSEFEKITSVPVIQERIKYLEKTIKLAHTDENRQYMHSVLLFSLFIEHVSLFSQFLIMMSFNK